MSIFSKIFKRPLNPKYKIGEIVGDKNSRFSGFYYKVIAIETANKPEPVYTLESVAISPDGKKRIYAMNESSLIGICA